MSSVGAGRGAQHLADWEDWALLTSAAVEAGSRLGPVSRRRICAQHDQSEQRSGSETLLEHDADRMRWFSVLYTSDLPSQGRRSSKRPN